MCASKSASWGSDHASASAIKASHVRVSTTLSNHVPTASEPPQLRRLRLPSMAGMTSPPMEETFH